MFKNNYFSVDQTQKGQIKKTYISVSLFAPPAGLEPATL